MTDDFSFERKRSCGVESTDIQPTEGSFGVCAVEVAGRAALWDVAFDVTTKRTEKVETFVPTDVANRLEGYFFDQFGPGSRRTQAPRNCIGFVMSLAGATKDGYYLQGNMLKVEGASLEVSGVFEDGFLPNEVYTHLAVRSETPRPIHAFYTTDDPSYCVNIVSANGPLRYESVSNLSYSEWASDFTAYRYRLDADDPRA